MNEKQPNPQTNQGRDDDALARELTKLHEQVAGVRDSDASVSEAQDFDDATSWRTTESDRELQNQLASAKRVMELLANTRPRPNAGLTDTVVDDAANVASKVASRCDSVVVDDGPMDIPSMIGRFEIKNLLGTGGFGLVFLANDPMLNRLVALKVPSFDSLVKAEGQARFEQESRVLASLSHPNIVPIFEIGNEGPISYIASEYVPGTDLAKWISQHGALDSLVAAKTVAVIADAIQHAHLRNVIHRDLKPANILIASDGTKSTFEVADVKVTDFGLAKVLEENDRSLTRTGSVIGTPAFAAPEQLTTDKNEEATESADIYSLGATLYYLLTAQAPFDASNIVELVQNVQTQTPVSPKQLAPETPADLSAICLKCLEKLPRDRYSNVHELSKDLERFGRGEPVMARPVPWHLRTARWVARNKLVAVSLATAFAAISIGFVFSSVQWRIAQNNLSVAVTQTQRAAGLLVKTEQSIDQMLTTTARVMKDLPAMASVREKLLRNALELQISILETESGNALVSSETIKAYARMAKIQIELGLFEDAKQSCDAAIELHAQLELPDPETQLVVAKAHQLLAAIFLKNSDLDNVQTHADLALELLDGLATLELAPETASKRAIAQSDVYRIRGRIAEGRNELEKAAGQFGLAVLSLKAEEFAGNLDVDLEFASELTSGYNSLAIVQKKLGQSKLAKESYEASLEINRLALEQAPDRRDFREKMALTSLNFGNLIFREFDAKDAGPHYERAADLLQELTIQHPMVFSYQSYLPSALHGVSLIQKNSGDYQAALATVQNSIDVIQDTRQLHGESDAILGPLASAYYQQARIESQHFQNYEAADEAFDNSLRIYESIVARLPTNTYYLSKVSSCLSAYAGSLMTRNDFQAALEKLRESEVAIASAIELNPKNSGFHRSLNFVRSKTVVSQCGANMSEKALEGLDSLQTDNLNSQQLVDWAETAVECLVMIEGQVDLEPNAKEVALNKYRDCAFEFLTAAKTTDGDRLGDLLANERLDSLRSDPRFEQLLGDN